MTIWIFEHLNNIDATGNYTAYSMYMWYTQFCSK